LKITYCYTALNYEYDIDFWNFERRLKNKKKKLYKALLTSAALKPLAQTIGVNDQLPLFIVMRESLKWYYDLKQIFTPNIPVINETDAMSGHLTIQDLKEFWQASSNVKDQNQSICYYTYSRTELNRNNFQPIEHLEKWMFPTAPPNSIYLLTNAKWDLFNYMFKVVNHLVHRRVL